MRRNIRNVHERTKRKTLKSVNIFGYLDFFMYLCHVIEKKTPQSQPPSSVRV